MEYTSMIIFNPRVYEIAALQINAGGTQISNLSRYHGVEIHPDMVTVNVFKLHIHEGVELDRNDRRADSGGADEAEESTRVSEGMVIGSEEEG